MKKIIFTLLLTALVIPSVNLSADASLISDRSYRLEQKRIQKQDIASIKKLIKSHNFYANKHDINNLIPLYSDNYMNNDGFNKKTYFKSVESTWKSCNDLTYDTRVISIDINGDNANVNVIETASGTVAEHIGDMTLAGEIHSTAKGIYHLSKINENWYITGETGLDEESSLLYGDARFMNIELQAPNQVAAGETYTVSLKVDADKDTFIIGSIDSDPVTYPSSTPETKMRALNTQTQTLERLLTSNSDNINEYAVASLAISKVQNVNEENFRIYMAGLACIMKRVNVIPKNNHIKIED